MIGRLLTYRKILKLICALQLFFCANIFAQGNFKLLGTIDKKYDEGYVKLLGYGIKFGSIKSDIKNGVFYFSDKIDKEYELIFLEVWKNDRIADIKFFIIPGEMRINIKNIDKDAKKYDIDFINIPFVDIQQEYTGLIDTDKMYANYFKVFDSLRKASAVNLADSLRRIFLLELRQKTLTARIEFIKNHKESYFALHAFFRDVINSPYINADSLSAIYSLFDNDLQHTVIGKQADSVINKKLTLPLNKELPGISFKTDSGKAYLIADYKDKQWVLVCFWASWCSPCIKNIPFLKKLDETYRLKGLQLISISIDDDEEKWKSAMQKNPMPWLQTCTLPNYITDQKIKQKFAVDGVPQYFLIDKSGKIVYNNFQAIDNENYSELQRILETQLK